MSAATWVSLAWLWADASDLLWSAYGVSSRIGRFVDRAHGIPLGRIALLEFEMLGEEQAEKPAGGGRFPLPPVSARPPHRMSASQHGALGKELQAGLQQLSQPWSLPKTHRRSMCRRRLREQLGRLQSMASGYASREHGDELAHRWYYGASSQTTAGVAQ